MTVTSVPLDRAILNQLARRLHIRKDASLNDVLSEIEELQRQAGWSETASHPAFAAGVSDTVYQISEWLRRDSAAGMAPQALIEAISNRVWKSKQKESGSNGQLGTTRS